MKSYSADGGALIELRQVVKIFADGARGFAALNGINLQVQPGEFLAVVGRSGSGKSTLLNMISGVDLPTSGEVIVGGLAIHRLGEGRRAVWRGRNLGLVFQFFQLLPTLTLLENVMMPMDLCHTYRTRQRKARAELLLRMVGLEQQAHRLPGAVSGGEQQRAAIARALANDPPILVADEPTGNLDSKSADAILRIFESLRVDRKTILIVTHDQGVACHATRTIVLSDGEVVREYGPGELAAQTVPPAITGPALETAQREVADA